MRKFLLLFLSLIFSLCLSAQTKLSLDEAVSIALQRNPALIKSKNNIESYKSSLRSAYGDLIPSLGANGSWNWSKTTDAGGTQTDYFGNIVQIPASEYDSRSYSLSAGGGVTLFDGLSNWANISQKDNQLESAKYSLEKLKQDIVLQTTDLFYSALNEAELLKVRQDNLQYNQKLFETIQERNRLGAVALADVYAQQVQLGNAQLLLIQQQNVFENAKSSLLNYLALDVLEEYDFVNPLPADKIIETSSYMQGFGDIQDMVNQAFINRLDYKSQNLNYESSLNGITIARGGIFPSLTGSYGFSTSATRPSDLFDRKVWSFGLNLRLPIFSNFNTDNAIQFAEVQAQNTKEDLSALERQIKIEVKQGYLDLVAAQKGLEVSQENVKSAEENRRVNNERYSLGSGTILDVLQSDRDYTQAQQDNINAKFLFYRLRDRLLNYLGKLEYNKFE